jgi:hypothetical protein
LSHGMQKPGRRKHHSLLTALFFVLVGNSHDHKAVLW